MRIDFKYFSICPEPCSFHMVNLAINFCLNVLYENHSFLICVLDFPQDDKPIGKFGLHRQRDARNDLQQFVVEV